MLNQGFGFLQHFFVDPTIRIWWLPPDPFCHTVLEHWALAENGELVRVPVGHIHTFDESRSAIIMTMAIQHLNRLKVSTVRALDV